MSLRIVLGLLAVLVIGAGAVVLSWRQRGESFLFGRKATETVEYTNYRPPQPEPEDVLTDDRLEDRKAPAFDPALVDRRPLGPKGEWLLNGSAAVLRLDVPLVKPDREPDLLTLHPSYTAAAGPDPTRRAVLPSVNMLDGKAKQFDDGLYAALDQAYYQGLDDKLRSHVGLVRRLYERVGKDSPAAPFLAAGLELAGVRVEVANQAEKDRLLADFNADVVVSRPTGFYTWNETLSACFRFLRFFQKPFRESDRVVPLVLAKALERDQALLVDYRKALAFYARLTNPRRHLAVADLVNATGPGQQRQPARGPVALFPASTSRETALVEKLFPLGLPADADLMRELVRRIRSGEVDLTPKPDSGWYDHQVYALETLLLPDKGREKNKLLLTRAYKKRMLATFQALVTKRRETHLRGFFEVGAAIRPLTEKVKPRLRVEPNPSYYLRTARAYGFLANFLEASVGPEALRQLHGLKQEGRRAKDLHAELGEMRELFYGLYLVSCEDIGLKPAFAAEEGVDPERCYQRAVGWLPKAFADEDLAADTRGAVPVYVDPIRGVVRLWLTLGVRRARLEASYARAPQIKPAQESGDWKEVEASRLEPAHYFMLVDEFAEVERPDRRVPTREELRAICGREKTKEGILKALRP